MSETLRGVAHLICQSCYVCDGCDAAGRKAYGPHRGDQLDLDGEASVVEVLIAEGGMTREDGERVAPSLIRAGVKVRDEVTL